MAREKKTSGYGARYVPDANGNMPTPMPTPAPTPLSPQDQKDHDGATESMIALTVRL